MGQHETIKNRLKFESAQNPQVAERYRLAHNKLEAARRDCPYFKMIHHLYRMEEFSPYKWNAAWSKATQISEKRQQKLTGRVWKSFEEILTSFVSGGKADNNKSSSM